MTGKRGSNQYIKARAKGLPDPVISQETREKLSKSSKGRLHTEETKKIISEKLSLNNKGGRCKWYEVDGIKVQGTWERDIAKKLNELAVKWIKPSKSIHSFKYIIEDKEKTYTPDMWLPEYGIYLEIKGYWWGNDKEKMECVKSQYPNTKFFVIEKKEYNRLMGGELVWS